MQLRSFLYAGIFTCLVFGTLAAAPGTFVSGSGNDNDPCTLLKPCRTFTRAIAQTDASGEVVALNCVVNGTDFGLWSLASGSLEVKDSTFRGNGSGIRVEPTSGTAQATISNVRLEGNVDGLDVIDGARVNVYKTVASGNSSAAFAASSFTSRSVELNIDSRIASNAHYGIAVLSVSTGPATVRLSNSIITNNSLVGLNIGNVPASLLSRGNNTVEGNAVDVFGVLSSYLPK
jgi:hypothetical protein